MRIKEFKALISLLEDPDEEIYRVISSKFEQEGRMIVPMLEKAWETNENPVLQERIEEITHRIQLKSTQKLLIDWINSGAQDLLAGAVFISNYQYPELEAGTINSFLEEVKNKVWHELNESLTPLEKIKVLNHIVFGAYGFEGNTVNFYSPNNHYINQVVETKKGGPVSLSILYSLVAHKLGMPVYGVSLPRNFILAYIDRFQTPDSSTQSKQSVLFYINPFSQGMILGRREIDRFLEHNNISPRDDFFSPCSNRTTIAQLIASLMVSYQKVGLTRKVDDLKIFLDIVSEQA